jgi:hypothetical protein
MDMMKNLLVECSILCRILLQLQQSGKKRPECFSPKNMNDCDTPLEEDKHIVA